MGLRRIVVLILLLVLVLSGCQSTLSYKSAAQKGFADLSGWDFTKQGNVSLDGSWAFYWDKLLTSNTFAGTEPTGFFNVPSYWTRYEGLNLPSFGRATYRLVVKTDGMPRLYGIKMPEIYTEYALWINGSLIEANGSFAGSEPIYLHPQAKDFYCDTSEIDIILQVKNGFHVYAGLGQSIRLGTSALIHEEQGFASAVDIILISVCVFAGLYYLILYLFRKNSREFICFFALCISVALRNLFSNGTLIMQVYPQLPFWLGSKLVTITVPVIIITMLYYTRNLFKSDRPMLLFNLVFWLNILYTLIVVAAPPGIYSSIFAPYLLTVGFACALGIYTSVKASLRKKGEAAFYLAGMLLLTAGAVLDALIYMQVVKINYVLSASVLCFIIVQVILLAKRYADIVRNAELLSNELQMSLDKLKNTETAFMSAQMKPHFLYNTLTTIAEKCETEPRTAGDLILSLSKYLRRTLDYDNLNGMVPLKKELELMHAYTSIECARFTNIEVVYDLPEPLPALFLPPLTLQPLVENAIKHGLRKRKEGGRVVIRAEYQDKYTTFTVEDNGIGMPDSVLKNLIVLPAGSVSIGLYNINARLMRLYGKGLNIVSKSGAGTCVRFDIPIRKDD